MATALHFDRPSGARFSPDMSVSPHTQPGPALTDQELWARLAADDRQGLTLLYRRYFRPLVNYGYQLCGDEAVVLETVGDLFESLMKSVHRTSTPASVKAYLFKAYRHTLRKKLRKSAVTMRLGVLAEADGTESQQADELLLNAQLDDTRKKSLKQALHSLGPLQREAVLLHYYEGMAYDQVAETLGHNRVATTRNLIYRSLSKLQQALHQHPEVLLTAFLVAAGAV